MKIKIANLNTNEVLLYKGETLKVGDVIDLPQSRAEHYVKRGKAVFIKDENKKTESQNK